MSVSVKDKETPERLRATLAALYKHRGAKVEHRLLATTAEIVFRHSDNWNGGTDYYGFVLHVPVDVFALLGDRQDAIERSLLQDAQRVLRGQDDESATLSHVVLIPAGSLTQPAAADVDTSMWTPDAFRLFISHVSTIKSAAHALKQELVPFGNR